MILHNNFNDVIIHLSYILISFECCLFIKPTNHRNNLAATSRDVLNERFAESGRGTAATKTDRRGKAATIHTTMGDITIQLFADEYDNNF